MTIIIYLSYKK